MCDFSQYSGANAELDDLLASLPAAPGFSLEDFKRSVNRERECTSQEEIKRLPHQVHTNDHSIRTRDGYDIEARTYRPRTLLADTKLPVYIHYHGGGCFIGTLGSEDASCSLIAIDTEVFVLNVNYRYTPEWRYPTAWHNSEDAFKWVYQHASEFGGDATQIVVGGISAGSTLSAFLAQTKKRENAVVKSLEGQILMIPYTVHQDCYDTVLRQMKSPEISSYTENDFAPISTLSRLRMFNDLLFSDIPDREDRKANVGNATSTELEGLPPTTFGIAGLDPLRDEALLYAKLLIKSGIPTDVHLFKCVLHSCRKFEYKLSANKHWDKVMHNGIRWALGRPVASGEFNIKAP